MKKLITLLLIIASFTVNAQTNLVGAWQKQIVSGDTLITFRQSTGPRINVTTPSTLADSLLTKVGINEPNDYNTTFFRSSINPLFNSGLNIPNAPTVSPSGISINAQYDNNYSFQIGAVTAAPNRLFFRDKISGAWNDWNEVPSLNRRNTFTDSVYFGKSIISTNIDNYIPTGIGRFLSAEYITDHAHYSFLADDQVNFSGVGLQARAAFNDNTSYSGTANSDHVHSFQSYPHWNSSGTVDRLSGFWSLPDVTNGSVTELSIFKANNPSGTGSIANLYGIYIPTLNRGTNNYSIFTGLTPSKFGAKIDVTGSVNSIFSDENDITGRMQATSTEVQISSSYNTTGSFKPLSFYTSDTKRMEISAGGVVNFTLSPTAPTPTANINNTQIATTAYADAKVQNSLTASTTIAPSATAVNTGLALKANIASPTFTGTTTVSDLKINNLLDGVLGADSILVHKSSDNTVRKVFASDLSIQNQTATAQNASYEISGTAEITKTGQTANTSIDGYTLDNNTAASSGNQQYSPSIKWQGNYWNTTASASRSVEFKSEVIPVQQVNGTPSYWLLSSNDNGGSFTGRLSVSGQGNVGIGTVSPTQQLSVQGSANTTANMGVGGVLTVTGQASFGSGLDASSKLQINSTTQGFLPPRMTTAQFTAIASKATGLETYDTTLGRKVIYNGTTSRPVMYTDDILTGSAILDFPSTGSNSSSDLTITVTGAVDGDVVTIGVPNASATVGTFWGYVSAADTVTIRFHNTSGGSADPSSGTFKAKVIK